jgi:Tol biopolymer transport system component
LVFAGTAMAAPANYAGTSADGKVVFFTTTEKLVPGDTDSRLDVYERSYDASLESYVTREVSTGPTGGNDAFDAFYDGASSDGTKVFFSTSESLVSSDTDRAEDIYMRNLATGTTTLVSAGENLCAGCGNGPGAAIYVDATSDGTRVDFVSSEQLSTADKDSAADVYQRDLTTGQTTLVSAGDGSCSPTCGNGAADALFQGASGDGEVVLFATTEKLVPADTDNLGDIYARDLGSGTTTLVSEPGTCPAEVDCTPAFAGVSADGSRVFFETNERIDTGDTDKSSDVYEWHAGTVNLVSTGPAGGNGPANATFEASAAGGSAVFFESSEQLVAADTDSAVDVYERSGGETTLVSTGTANLPASFDKVSADGATVIFSTAESLSAEDGDEAVDVYSRSGGVTTLISTAPGTGKGPFNVGYAGASDDATHVLFETVEPLLPQDTDGRGDIYERFAGSTKLVSTGPVGNNGPFDPNLTDVSSDGAHAFFITEERLTEGDLDTERDVYDFSASGTLLVSVGNFLQLGPPTPALTGTNPPTPNASTTPAVIGQAEEGTLIKVYATPDCSGATVGTGTSLELATSGITVQVEAGSTTTFHATATDANGDTSVCSSSSATYRQATETPPPTEEGGGGTGGGTSGGTTGGGTSGGEQPAGGKGSGSGGGGRSSSGAVAPQTKVTFAPLFKTRARRPVIGFVDATGQEGTSFKCRVDKQPWRKCASPFRLKTLSLGTHSVRIKGVNSGIWESRPVVRKFKVVRR